MNQITQHGRQALHDIGARHQVSDDAMMQLLQALQRGHGTAAQFSIGELGGMGQWSRGGMTQVGDMFNDALKAKVNAVCTQLAELLAGREIFEQGNEPHDFNPDGSSPAPSGGGKWWPDGLGSPASTGGQNDMQYALFPARHRLAVRQDGQVRVYDSGNHEIHGFAQSQNSDGQSLKFSSQHGTIGTDDLQLVE